MIHMKKKFGIQNPQLGNENMAASFQFNKVLEEKMNNLEKTNAEINSNVHTLKSEILLWRAIVGHQTVMLEKICSKISPVSKNLKLLPLKTLEDVKNLDAAAQNTLDDDLIAYVRSIIGTTPVSKSFHLLFDDEALREINWDGRQNKYPIKSMNFFKNIFYYVIAYGEIARVLREVAPDDSVTIVVITAVGDFFTAGNDLSQTEFTDTETHIKESNLIFKSMVSAAIDCPKILIALVNGPCIGIGVTLAGLCDLVWCSDTTYFHTPFVSLGIVPEASSSYLFSLIIGRSKATELLLFSQKMTAEDAYHYHFVSRVFKFDELSSVILPKIQEFSELPPESMQTSKKLMRMHERDALYKALNAEVDAMNHRLHSEEFFNALIKFAMRKKSNL